MILFLKHVCYVPADDLTDHALATTFAHLDATIVLSRGLAAMAVQKVRPGIFG